MGQHASLSKITGPHATGALSHVSELIGKPDCGTLPQAVVVKRGILLVVPVLEIRVTLGGSQANHMEGDIMKKEFGKKKLRLK